MAGPAAPVGLPGTALLLRRLGPAAVRILRGPALRASTGCFDLGFAARRLRGLALLASTSWLGLAVAPSWPRACGLDCRRLERGSLPAGVWRWTGPPWGRRSAPACFFSAAPGSADSRPWGIGLALRRPGLLPIRAIGAARAGGLGSGRTVLEALDGMDDPLLGRPEVSIADGLDPGQHVLHLLLGVRIGHLEVAQVVEHAANPGREPLVAAVESAADLPLDHRGVVEVVALGLREPVGLRRGCERRSRPA